MSSDPFPCIACGHMFTAVSKTVTFTRQFGPTVIGFVRRRFRHCRSCGHTFSTSQSCEGTGTGQDARFTTTEVVRYRDARTATTEKDVVSP